MFPETNRRLAAAGGPVAADNIAASPPIVDPAADERALVGAELRGYQRGRAQQLEESNGELNSLAYSISHDLRAPLRHVVGFGKILSKSTSSVLSSHDRELVELVLSAGLQMDRLMDGLLRYSRLGSRELVLVEIDLRLLVDEIMRQVEFRTEGRVVCWEIQPLPRVRADKVLLSEALLHLIDNALKFTVQSEQADIEIGCVPGSKAEDVLFVRDNGIGFDPKFAEKIYGVFQRLHGEGEYEGSGVGLSLVRRIASRHGGRTWAEGQENQGATFYVSLPKLEPEAMIHPQPMGSEAQ